MIRKTDAARTLRAGVVGAVLAGGRKTGNNGGRKPGEVLLAEADKLGADLIVKGAYTQSRLRQMIFGGATSHLLAHSHLPMIMAR